MARKADRLQGLPQVRALAHPLRLRLVEEFARGPATPKQVAERLGQPPTRLYHHVAVLERAGLIRLSERKAKRGATEKYYETTTRRFLGGPEVTGVLAEDGAGRDRAAVGAMIFDQARTELVQALATHGQERRPPMMAVRLVAHLSPALARKVTRDLQTVLDHLSQQDGMTTPNSDARSSRRNRRRYSLTIAFTPTGGSRPD